MKKVKCIMKDEDGILKVNKIYEVEDIYQGTGEDGDHMIKVKGHYGWYRNDYFKYIKNNKKRKAKLG
jgi:hypothetical protein